MTRQKRQSIIYHFLLFNRRQTIRRTKNVLWVQNVHSSRMNLNFLPKWLKFYTRSDSNTQTKHELSLHYLISSKCVQNNATDLYSRGILFESQSGCLLYSLPLPSWVTSISIVTGHSRFLLIFPIHNLLHLYYCYITSVCNKALLNKTRITDSS